MNVLEMYKKLSATDKKHLSEYCIYNSIYTIAKGTDYEISDEEVERIKELSHYIYLKDEYYNLSPSRISDFISECYIVNKVPLEKLEEASWSDTIEAIDNENFEYSNDLEVEDKDEKDLC